jgi:hypothetical protein
MQATLETRTPRFAISIERAINLGNYESLRVGLSQSCDVGSVSPDAAYKTLLEKVVEWTSKAKPSLDNPGRVPNAGPGAVLTHESLR